MGLWDRIRRTVASRRHGDDAQDNQAWRERMHDTVRDQQSTLAQLRRSLADLSTNRRRVELQLGKLQQQSGQLDAEAAAKVAAGDDAGARAALSRKVTIDKAVADLTSRHESLVADEQRLTATADRVQTQIDDFRIRTDTLAARQSAATAKTEMYRAERDHGEIAGDLDAVDRRTREAEATAAAYDELADPTDAAQWDELFDGQSQQGGADGPKPLSQ